MFLWQNYKQMKKNIFILIFSLISLTFWAQNKTVLSIISQSTDYIDLIENSYEKQIVHIQYDVIVNEKEVYRKLFADVQYGILVVPDEYLTDVDLKVQFIENDVWTTKEEDITNEGVAMIYFTPSETGMYKLVINSTHKNQDDFGFYSLIIFR